MLRPGFPQQVVYIFRRVVDRIAIPGHSSQQMTGCDMGHSNRSRGGILAGILRLPRPQAREPAEATRDNVIKLYP